MSIPGRVMTHSSEDFNYFLRRASEVYGHNPEMSRRYLKNAELIIDAVVIYRAVRDIKDERRGV